MLVVVMVDDHWFVVVVETHDSGKSGLSLVVGGRNRKDLLFQNLFYRRCRRRFVDAAGQQIFRRDASASNNTRSIQDGTNVGSVVVEALDW